MKKMSSLSIFSLFVCLVFFSVSGCQKPTSPVHSSPRHPSPAPPSQEHPQGSLEQWQKAEAMAGKTRQSLIAEYSQAVDDYVKQTLRTTGTLPVKDVQGRDVEIPGKLELVRIMKDKITPYKRNTYFACSDFLAKSGNTQTKYDLDFFMTHVHGAWKLNKILLHKMDGKPQMMYVDNKPVPITKKQFIADDK